MPPVSSPGRSTAQRSLRHSVSAPRAALPPGHVPHADDLCPAQLAQLLYGNKRVGRVALRSAAPGGPVQRCCRWSSGSSRTASPSGLDLRPGCPALAAAAPHHARDRLEPTSSPDAWRLGQPLTLTMGHQRARPWGQPGAVPLDRCSHPLALILVRAQRSSCSPCPVTAGCQAPTTVAYNVLLLGGDSGAGRWGLPDSMTVASIDAETGRTVLISLPRNMQNFRSRRAR